MNWYSALAIYVLLWVLAGFVVLPFGVKRADELGEELVPGQEPGAPANFRPRRVVFWTTIVSGVWFAVFLLIYEMGWINRDTLAAMNPFF